MQAQRERAMRLAALHVKGRPLVLYNAWDAGSAKAVASAGARAIGTSSWAVAAAQGYEDGEALPAAFMVQLAGRVAQAVDLPVTVDVEGAYSSDPQRGAEHVGLLLEQGIAGINFEDRVVGGEGLHGVEAQAARIAAIRRLAEERGIPLFINARTDLFFGTARPAHALLDDALARADAYAAAGASGLFVPGLADLGTIAQLAARIALPLNVMMMPGMPAPEHLATAGVARISHGPHAYMEAMESTRAAAAGLLA